MVKSLHTNAIKDWTELSVVKDIIKSSKYVDIPFLSDIIFFFNL